MIVYASLDVGGTEESQRPRHGAVALVKSRELRPLDEIGSTGTESAGEIPPMTLNCMAIDETRFANPIDETCFAMQLTKPAPGT